MAGIITSGWSVLIFILVVTTKDAYGQNEHQENSFEEIPVAVAQRLNEEREEVTLLITSDTILSLERTGKPLQHSNLGTLLPEPGCKPRLTLMHLMNVSSTLIYRPSCVMLGRCGGCCHHERLACQVKSQEPVNITVQVYKYDSTITASNNVIPLRKVRDEFVLEANHTSCKCYCITTEKDCNKLQRFVKGNCECFCTNTNAEKLCKTKSSMLSGKHWDPSTCSCGCLEVRQCSSGLYFNNTTCKCEASVNDDFRNPNYYKGNH